MKVFTANGTVSLSEVEVVLVVMTLVTGMRDAIVVVSGEDSDCGRDCNVYGAFQA